LKGFAMKRVSLVVTLALAAGFSTQAATAQTLKTVKDRGMLSCGVSQGLPGFSSPDDKGNWTGLDVDVCRAVAAAIFNDQIRAVVGQGSFYGAAIRRNRRTVA
jgi:general L-amino acid transport system substrate-binding protein